VDTNIVNPNDIAEVVNITTSVYLASLNLQESVRMLQNAQREVLRLVNITNSVTACQKRHIL
jgi:hypothetical protein